jgi:hypothetical protein
VARHVQWASDAGCGPAGDAGAISGPQWWPLDWRQASRPGDPIARSWSSRHRLRQLVQQLASVPCAGAPRWWRPGLGAGLEERSRWPLGAALAGPWSRLGLRSRLTVWAPDPGPRRRGAVRAKMVAAPSPCTVTWRPEGQPSRPWPVVLATCAEHRNPAAWAKCWRWLPVFPTRSAAPRWKGSPGSAVTWLPYVGEARDGVPAAGVDWLHELRNHEPVRMDGYPWARWSIPRSCSRSRTGAGWGGAGLGCNHARNGTRCCVESSGNKPFLSTGPAGRR